MPTTKKRRRPGRPKGPPTEPVTIRFPVGTIARLRRHCRATGVPISWAVAKAVEEWLHLQPVKGDDLRLH